MRRQLQLPKELLCLLEQADIHAAALQVRVHRDQAHVPDQDVPLAGRCAQEAAQHTQVRHRLKPAPTQDAYLWPGARPRPAAGECRGLPGVAAGQQRAHHCVVCIGQLTLPADPPGNLRHRTKVHPSRLCQGHPGVPLRPSVEV